jgi:hypothetical protein
MDRHITQFNQALNWTAMTVTNEHQFDIVAIPALQLSRCVQHRIQTVGDTMGSCETRDKVVVIDAG